MNINNIEEELRLVLRDKRFKLSNAGHRDNLINIKLIIMNCSERVEIIIPILFLNVLIL